MENQHLLEKLLEIEQRMIKAPRRSVLGGEDWAENIPELGGVYVIWDSSTGDPVYVGETCHLNHRLGDLKQKTRHTFRRKIAKILNLEDLSNLDLSKKISERYELSYLRIPFGRKEVEEFIVLRWSETLINKPQGRLRLSKNYYSIGRKNKFE